jgi:hypothetical protein
LQPGGHRFDPGQLHQNLSLADGRWSLADSRWLEETRVRLVDSIVSLGGLLVPIVAIIVGGAIAVTTMILRHQERIAKIERGIDPDAGPRA